MRKSEFFFVAGLPKAGTTSLVTWMTEALGLPSTLKEPGFLYDCPRSVSCFRGGRLTARQVRFGDLPFDVECVVDGSPHYLHSQHFPNFLRVVNDLRGSDHKVKIVVVLKDPIERAISHFNHHKRDNSETFDIDAALAPGCYAERVKQVPNLWTGYDYLGDSQFADSVHALKRELREDELFITFSPLLFDDPQELERLAKFLGLGIKKTPKFRTINASGEASSVAGRIIMKSVQLGSAIAANLVTSAVATARLKALKQWVLSFLTLEKPRNSDLSDALREKLIMLFDAEYNLLGQAAAAVSIDGKKDRTDDSTTVA